MRIPKSVTAVFSFIPTLLIVYLLLCLAFYVLQRRMLFFPTAEVEQPDTAHVAVDTGGARLKIWVLNPGRPEALLYFGGNAENVAYDIGPFAEAFPDRTLYLVNYRGFGGSSGTPSEAGLCRDARALYDRFAPDHDALSVMGRSIGAAVALCLASERAVRKLILITPFDSGVRVAQELYPFFPMGLILRDRYDGASRVASVSAPTLIVAAGADEIIPRENTLALARAFPAAQLRFETLPQTGHNTLQRHPDYYRLLRAFLREKD